MIKGMGGAMDLVAGVKKIIVVMEHASKNGDPKFIPECTLPLTGKNVVDMIVTDLCVFHRPDHDSPFRLIELAPDVTAEEVAAKTTAGLRGTGRRRPGMRAAGAFTPKLITTLREGYDLARLRADAIAGLTVAIVALPLAMALGIASGASPRRGPGHGGRGRIPDLGAGRVAGADRRPDRRLRRHRRRRDRASTA